MREITDPKEIEKAFEELKQNQDTVLLVGPNSWCLGLKCQITFGKYNGKLLEDIINSDPSYVEWQLRENDKFVISKKAAEILKSKGFEVPNEKFVKGY